MAAQLRPQDGKVLPLGRRVPNRGIWSQNATARAFGLRKSGEMNMPDEGKRGRSTAEGGRLPVIGCLKQRKEDLVRLLSDEVAVLFHVFLRTEEFLKTRNEVKHVAVGNDFSLTDEVREGGLFGVGAWNRVDGACSPSLSSSSVKRHRQLFAGRSGGQRLAHHKSIFDPRQSCGGREADWVLSAANAASSAPPDVLAFSTPRLRLAAPDGTIASLQSRIGPSSPDSR